MKGLDEGYDPNMLDVCDLIFEAWEDVSERTLARCWLKADILPRSTSNKLIGIHGKVKREKKFIEEVDILSIAEIFSKIQLSSTEDEASGAGVLTSVDLRRWVTIEDEKDVREALVNESFDDCRGKF
eukprot:IDg3380t1